MAKILLRVLIFIPAGALLLAACVPSNFLSGTGGEGEGGTYPTEDESIPTEPPVEEPPPDHIEELSQTAVTNFYLPTLTIIVSDDGNNYETGVSIPPMGTAEYQVTVPKELVLGEERLIELILVPDTLKIEKNKIFQDFEKNLYQPFQGDILIYPKLNAEIVVGSAFSVSSFPSSDQIILLDNVTKWTWYITALDIGSHSLFVNISVPVSDGKTITKFPLEQIKFNINVLKPSPTPTPTFTPIPTSTFLPTNTPIPSIGDQLFGNATSITNAVIGVCGGVFTTLVGIFFSAYMIEMKNKKKELDKEASDKKAREKKNKEILEDWKKPKRKDTKRD